MRKKTQQGPARGERGKWLPGETGNPAGYSLARRLEKKAITEALQNHYTEDDILSKADRAWEAADKNDDAKTMIMWLKEILPWYSGGKLPTKHIRINTKFEDMLAALGSNEPVTIEGEAEEAQ